jgi:hypothetical protein
MQDSGVSLDEYTYSSILHIIADLGNLQEGQQIHTQLTVIQSRKNTKYSHFTGELWRPDSLSYDCCKFTHLHVFEVW